MSIGQVKSRVCVKRLLDEPQDVSPRVKKARLVPPPLTTGLSPCFTPKNTASKLSPAKFPSKVGPYLLLERCEGEETYKAVHAHTQQQYTCQILPLRGYQEQLAAYARVERHDNICGLLDVVVGQDCAYIFLPAHHGDMHAYVRDRKRVSEEEARNLFSQMLNAVMHCHHNGLVLRDLKLRRFVFTDKHRTRLSVLGLDDCVLLHDNDDSLTDRHGCPAYVGPELLSVGNKSYSGRAADIWSMGVSLYTMLIGRYPFQDTQPAALFAKIRRGTFSFPNWLSPQAKCLISCMLRKSPDERLEASQLLMHPWFTNPGPLQHVLPKTHNFSNTTSHQRQEDNDQVVPTWTPKH